MAHLVNGLITEIITSFNPDGSIDYEATGDLIDFQIKNGAAGLFVNGLGNESYALTYEERTKILEVAIERCKGKNMHIMACVYVTCVREGKKLMDAYKGLDFTSICITAPAVENLSDEALFEFTDELMKYTDKPVYLFSCREMATLYSPELLERLAKANKNFQGYKDATQNPVHIIQCMMRLDRKKYDFLCGCDGTLVSHMMLGCSGTVSFTAVPFPREIKAIIDLVNAGKIDEAMEAQFRIMRIRDVLKKGNDSAPYIYAMKFTGGKQSEGSRYPKDMYITPDWLIKEIDQVMVDTGIKPYTY